MRVPAAGIGGLIRRTRLRGATALVCLAAVGLLHIPADAQDIGNLATEAQTKTSGSQMLLEADNLIYDNDANTVTAAGGVRIDYAGNKLVAERVTYDRGRSRLIASGGVEIVDSDGTKIYSDKIDITDDFANGFVNALRVESVDKTYFAAESAERSGGLITTFNNGVYTACKPCEDHPDRAPIWRIKARKIIWNGQSKTVRFERGSFEFYGLPIAQFPAFEIADPTVKRKSGFLIPGVRIKSDLGYGLAVPYYFALSPTYDLTVTGTGYTKQGFLGEAEWRQRFNNGQYSFKVAGINQADPEGFAAQNTVDSGPIGDPNRFRGMVGTKGNFDLNPRWKFGWDILAQTDKNFAYTYGVTGYNDYIHQSEVYLTGLNDRNYFDLRAQHFQVQENILNSDATATDQKQPWVLPTLDYSYTPDKSVLGGELDFDLNAREIYRDDLANTTLNTDYTQRGNVVPGIEGDSSRITAQAEWKRSFVSDGGLVMTPLLALQADADYVDASNSSVQAINALAAAQAPGSTGDVRTNFARVMPTAGLEMRWPVLFSMVGSSQVLEPMAQLFARPDEGYTSTFGIPNEDAQSFVFDATTLFDRDKFSGYDRIEGGSRANVGLRYTGSYDNGWSTNGLFGQSYRVAGRNSFDSPDLVYAGASSGLETDTSDYVGLIGFAAPFGLAASLSGRFDEQTFETRRGEAKASLGIGNLSLGASYAFIQQQPLYGFTDDRQQVFGSSSLRFNQNWRAFGSGTYDFEGSLLINDSVGFAYDDECFSYSVTMSTARDVRRLTSNSNTFGVNVSFRTLGDFGTSTGTLAQ